MKDKALLLVEDNPQDEMLTLRTLRRANVVNHIDVVRDGQQALDYLFRTGEFAGRDAPPCRPWWCSTSACRGSTASRCWRACAPTHAHDCCRW